MRMNENAFFIKYFCILLFTGVLMNSLSSVLTYTDMDLAAILGKERSGARHQSSLGKQVVYFFIVLGIQIGLVSYKVDTSSNKYHH